jgi:HK97 family phage major capsid protein
MLKQLAIGANIARHKKDLAIFMSKRSELDTRAADHKKRQDEIEAVIAAMNAETPDEEHDAVVVLIEALQEEETALQAETDELGAKIDSIEGVIAELQEELAAIGESAESDPVEDEERTARRQSTKPTTRKGDNTHMNKRNSFFRNMSIQERNNIIQSEEVRSFKNSVLSAVKEKRAIAGGDLLIPEVLVGILNDNIGEHSKLAAHVNMRHLPGTGKIIIQGTPPEAIWTDNCVDVPELSISYNAVQLDGNRVGGFVSICNAILEDATEVNLVDDIMSQIAQGIGEAIDRAILYGTGNSMPMGIATRIAQTSAPANLPNGSPAWTDLHTSNVRTLDNSLDGVKFYKPFLNATSVAKSKYSDGRKFWAMCDSTYQSLLGNLLNFNAAGAIVSGMQATMPLAGGEVVILPDNIIPDGTIIGGYGSLYYLAERAGAVLSSSTHARFTQYQTLFMGIARYDGKPVIGEGFVAIGINGTAPVLTSVFPPVAPPSPPAPPSGS